MNSLEVSHAAESERQRVELTRLRGAEEDAKNNANKVTSLLEELERLRKDLQNTQKEKKAIEDWARTYQDEMEQVLLVRYVVVCRCDVPALVRASQSTLQKVEGDSRINFLCH